MIAVSVNNLSISYNTEAVVNNLNFDIPEASYVAIVGPNGSGKTTLLKTLLGIIKPQTGNISLFGEDINKINPLWLGYVPQIKTLDRSFPATAIELVVSGLNRKWSSFIKKSDMKTAMEALESVGAKSFAREQLANLSGGQLQRVYLARCFVRKPKILLLDEPATGVDLVCETSINKLIENYNKENNATIIMVTHDWSAAYHHTQLVLLINKEQVFFGKPDEAFSDVNLQKTFSHLGHHHKVKFGIKSNA